jgi:hypothetical protein
MSTHNVWRDGVRAIGTREDSVKIALFLALLQLA